MEELTRKTKQLEGELGTTSKKLEVAVLMQRDDAEKIKTSEEMVRSLTLQVLTFTFHISTLKNDFSSSSNRGFDDFLLFLVDGRDQERSRQDKETPKLVLM